MITVRPAGERGHVNLGWLDSYHTFSFGDYHDPSHMGFSHLRVINEDFVLPGKGFGTHAHRDMEIITVVLEGVVEHKDSMGTGSVIKAGEVQRMSAGTGVTHSEFNPSKQKVLHFLQIWILPDRNGLEPEYEQNSFPESARRGGLRLVASPDGRDGSLTIHQDAEVYISSLDNGQKIAHTLARGRRAWLQIVTGQVALLGRVLKAGDGAAVQMEPSVEITAQEGSGFLLFTLA